jgi:hypothetical protein
MTAPLAAPRTLTSLSADAPESTQSLAPAALSLATRPIRFNMSMRSSRPRGAARHLPGTAASDLPEACSVAAPVHGAQHAAWPAAAARRRTQRCIATIFFVAGEEKWLASRNGARGRRLWQRHLC